MKGGLLYDIKNFKKQKLKLGKNCGRNEKNA